jgi:hypothetical protein
VAQQEDEERRYDNKLARREDKRVAQREDGKRQWQQWGREERYNYNIQI